MRVTGFNPRLSAELMRGSALIRMGKPRFEQPEAYFRGNWEERNALNVPGPFYGAETDTCLDGPGYAPESLLCDASGQGFVWRQPRSDAETLALMTGASSDPFSGFGWDGDLFWTPSRVRDWWEHRNERLPLINDLIAKFSSADGLHDTSARWTEICTAYRRYIAGGLADDLRRYLFFLEMGSYPSGRETLPDL